MARCFHTDVCVYMSLACVRPRTEAAGGSNVRETLG